MRRKYQSDSNIPASPSKLPELSDGEEKRPSFSRQKKEDYYFQNQESIQKEMFAIAKQQKESVSSAAPNSAKKSKKLSIFSRDYWVLLFGVFLLTFGLAIPFLYILLTRLGLGHYFPNQAEYLNMNPLLPESALEIVAKLQFPPGNIAVSAHGRVFFTFHPEYSPPVNVAELRITATTRSDDITYSSWSAFPSKEFQRHYQSVLSIRIDSLNRLWLLDFAHHAIQHSPVLYGFQLASFANKSDRDELIISYTFPKAVAGFGSMLNDFQVDPSGEFLYIIDTSILSLTPALIVFSIRSNRGYRMLQGHSSLYGSSIMIQMYAYPNSVLRFGPLGMQIHGDSIALDRTGSRLYYGALTGNSLYSISTTHLLSYVRRLEQFNKTIIQTVEKKLHDYVILVTDQKPITDGLSTDNNGNIWITAVEHSSIFAGIPINPKENSAVGVTDLHSLNIVKVVSSPSLLRWPDGFSFGADGLYITNSALHYKFLQQNVSEHKPFHILRLPNKALESLKVLFSKKRFQSPLAGH